MMNKLSFRNIQRSMKDYLIYVMTMSVITAFMYAFSSLFFDKELSGTFEMSGIMGAMIGIATFFIVLIVAWLINYMVKFMLEKRSTEFGIYMLLGMKKKKIADLYLKENCNCSELH
ncbi:FtsX-like permease family protein [Hespellia stercorisuis]|uniref:FtsX-like permease family n=1 Tax=Hespellia stercorisuis DSM 15480 TaxID=1121950 RepID=A0A1M6X5L0_9FIRM|nr:FtsX-like permease family protein [Hespellia stercorisuis]SHL01228.1 FtsX-like permease family [Hespellia stercorisuis DSM 15480]